MTTPIPFATTHEAPLWRAHRYASCVRVLSLTGAGKRGKRLPEFALYDIDYTANETAIGDAISAAIKAAADRGASVEEMTALVSTLAAEHGGTIAFVGGVDTQHLLVHATPEEIKAEVRRLRAVLGPNLIVSPSHEAILPNVPLENVKAMAEAAKEP